MGKRKLGEYLSGLSKLELEAQVLDLYGRFKEVKEFYDFVFDPKEEKRVHEAKVRITEEYFPVRRKRAKARRSVAGNLYRNFEKLGMAPEHLCDLLLFHLEVAQTYARDRHLPDAFYKSKGASFEKVIRMIVYHGLVPGFSERAVKIVEIAVEDGWPNSGPLWDMVESHIQGGEAQR